MKHPTKTEIINEILSLDPTWKESIHKLHCYYTRKELLTILKRMKENQNES